jgi:hypothetical protein
VPDQRTRIVLRPGSRPAARSRGVVRASRLKSGKAFGAPASALRFRQSFDARARHSAGTTNRLATDSCTAPGPPELPSDPYLVVLGDPNRPRDRAVAIRHQWIVARRASLALICPLRGCYGGSALEERLNGPEFGPSSGGTPDLRARGPSSTASNAIAPMEWAVERRREVGRGAGSARDRRGARPLSPRPARDGGCGGAQGRHRRSPRLVPALMVRRATRRRRQPARSG